MDYVTLTNGTKYVLRIYNNGLNSARVSFEHRVLDGLRNEKFSFALPIAERSLDGRMHVFLSSGAEACLFKFIPGESRSC
jgi:Ser/Thr protein kinase RdoA (MazF antagonist)